MERLIKLSNFHCNEGKIQFQTFINEETKIKTYCIIDSIGTHKVTKDEGNEIFKQLRLKYPKAKMLTIFDVKE